MTNDCLSARPSSFATVRPTRSRPPPGLGGTMIFTGRAGYACAAASPGSRINAASNEATGRFMTVPSRRIDGSLPERHGSDPARERVQYLLPDLRVLAPRARWNAKRVIGVGEDLEHRARAES